MTDVPPAPRASRGKYNDVYSALDKMKAGEWLPVGFESQHDAYNFRVAATSLRRLALEARLRGDTVYVRKRMAKNGNRSKGGK